MSYHIEPIFLLYPLLCLLVHFSNIRQKRGVFFFLTALFIAVYSFSLNGSDFDGYYAHFNMVERGVSAVENEQEIGFYFLMKTAVFLGFDYLTFRVVMLTVLTLVLFASIRRFTSDFALSLFFVSSMFVIYTISAYRQYIVIAFSLYWVYLYCRGKRRLAIMTTALLLLFHITAILPLCCMLFDSFRQKRKVKRSTDRFQRHFTVILIAALVIRVVIAFLLQTGIVNAIVSGVLGLHASATPTLFSFGLVSRLFFLAVITYFFRLSNTADHTIRFLFWYYFVSIIIYIAIPLEFVMGRLMNNASILCAVLIPMLKREVARNVVPLVNGYRLAAVTRLLFALELAAFAILVNQLLHQNGYTPYMNVLLGDRPADLAMRSAYSPAMDITPGDQPVLNAVGNSYTTGVGAIFGDQFIIPYGSLGG